MEEPEGQTWEVKGPGRHQCSGEGQEACILCSGSLEST